MPFVLDSSVTLAWLLPDEGTEATDALADRLQDDYALVPAIWSLEVGNALLIASRRGRIKPDELDQMATALGSLPIEVEPPAGGRAVPGMVRLAADLGLTTYDASYLELAQRRGLPLATLDTKLREACNGLRLPVLP
jgi:predicted nucleic acid-binding protein